MKAIAVLLLFIGMFLVTQGYYSKYNMDNCPEKVQIKYVPRSIYDEQLAPDTQDYVSKQFQSLFETIQPWPGLQQPIGIPNINQNQIPIPEKTRTG
jgi:hypothetical protein